MQNEVQILCVCGNHYFGMPEDGGLVCPECNHFWELFPISKDSQETIAQRMANRCREAMKIAEAMKVE